MVYNTVRQAIEAKKCHFCKQQMIPSTTGLNARFEIKKDNLIYSEDITGTKFVSLDKIAPANLSVFQFKALQTYILSFRCPTHLYRSDITLYLHPNLEEVMLLRCHEEEVVINDVSRAFVIRNIFDLKKTSIFSLKENLYIESFDQCELDILFDLFNSRTVSVPLKPFPDTIQELLDRTRIYLTFS